MELSRAVDNKRESSCPLVDIQLIEAYLVTHRNKRMIKAFEAIARVEGDGMRGVTWVRVKEFASGGIGDRGKASDNCRCESSQSEPA